MAQIRTVRRIRLGPSSNIRWVLVMGLGVLVSIAYYAALIWGGVWAVRAVMAWATTP